MTRRLYASALTLSPGSRGARGTGDAEKCAASSSAVLGVEEHPPVVHARTPAHARRSTTRTSVIRSWIDDWTPRLDPATRARTASDAAQEAAGKGNEGGGRYWTRTSDPQLVELVLYQLS